MKKEIFAVLLLLMLQNIASGQTTVSPNEMKKIYEEVKTPNKYGLVMTGLEKGKSADCPTIFRSDERWYMYYFVFDGRGYETWMAVSDNLLAWQTLGRVLSFSKSSDWDANQKGGCIALADTRWGGSYAFRPYNGKYWMSYLGGNEKGYEKGNLSIGIAHTERNPIVAHEWERLDQPVLASKDSTASWWDSYKLHKNSIIEDRNRLTGYRFVMYYNAKGDQTKGDRVERIGMAASNDMTHWKRLGTDPVLDHQKGFTGDAYLQKINNIWVMFYFGAFWNKDPKIKAWNSFACSKDLVNWTDWQGEPLLETSAPFDFKFVHKPCVIKWNGVVYHFYCSIDKNNNRGIALATSKDLGTSTLKYPIK